MESEKDIEFIVRHYDNKITQDFGDRSWRLVAIGYDWPLALQGEW